MSSVYEMLHGTLQQVLFHRLGWSALREIQERAYRVVSAGKDTLIIAPTAGGKSEAAVIPVIDGILKHGYSGVSCLYLSPLKALINDQEERFVTFCAPAGLTVLKWHGDVPKGDRAWKEEEPPHILMITPESLEVLLREPAIMPDLARLRYIIIDEVHAFADSERGVQLLCLLDRIDQLARTAVQRIGLSATVGNPDEVLDWCAGGRHTEKELVAVPVPPREKRFAFIVEPDEARRMEALARVVSGKKALVFMNSRADAERAAKALRGRVEHLSVHHSSLSPELRRAAESVIAGEGGGCIICTSTLELGIDIGDLDVVVQVGPPVSVSSFLQRMGRSGRRLRAAFVAWVLKNPCELLISAAVIECASRNRIEPLAPPERPYNVLIQQILLMLHSAGRSSRPQLAQALAARRPFRGLPRERLDRLVSHLLNEGYLVADGDMLMPGPAAEREFGRSNWKEIYSVIAGGSEYRAVTPEGELVGSLDARFVTSRGASDFALGGTSWQVVKCDDAHSMVVVVPGEAGKSRVFWRGGQSGLSPLLCDAVQRIVSAGKSGLPLSPRDRALLQKAIGEMPAGISRHGLHVWERSSETGKFVLVLSFKGMRFNRILAALLSRELEGKGRVQYHDLAVSVRNAGKGGAERVTAALCRVKALSREEIGNALVLPPRESWKFAGALPEDMFREMVLSDYFGVGGFCTELTRSPISSGEREGSGEGPAEGTDGGNA